jgi:nucleotide-binding universal stress UspA family protein
VDQLLLAYDGSYKGNEALFLSAYLSIKWGVPLYVLTVVEKGRSAGVAQEIARRYLTGHSVTATYLAYEGDVVDIFLNVAHAQRSSLLIIGGYSFSPVVDSVSGSTVDKVLRKADLPVLICE